VKQGAAAITTAKDAHLITNEEAADKFGAALAHLAREAAGLPAIGTAGK